MASTTTPGNKDLSRFRFRRGSSGAYILGHRHACFPWSARRGRVCAGEDFIAWSDTYVAPLVVSLLAPDEVSGADLYGARCGVVHTSTAASRRADEGAAREIYYQFRGQTGVNLAANTPLPSLLIDIDALVDAVEKGSQRFLSDLVQDQVRLGEAQERAKRFFIWGSLNTSGWSN